MKSIYVRLLLPILTIAFLLIAVGGVSSTKVSADGHGSDESQSNHVDDGADNEERSDQEDVQVSGNNYTAAACQSLTELVRADISSRADSLTPQQRVAAETWATQELGSYQISEGQSVTLSESVINAAITRAEALSTTQQEAWTPYARLVGDFAARIESEPEIEQSTSDSDTGGSDDISGETGGSDADDSDQAENDSESDTGEDDDSPDEDADDSESSESEDSEEDPDQESDDVSQSSGNLPWIAAAAIAAGGWVILRRRESQSKK